MASETFLYCEMWSALQAAGGTRKGFFLPAQTARRRQINGDDRYQVQIPNTNRCVPFVAKGAVIREVLSLDGLTWREWVIDTYQMGSGADWAVSIDCFSPLQLLVNYPVETVDGDGFVYQETSAIQLAIATIVSTYLRSRTPAWVVNGTLDPTGLWECPFSRDSTLSGGRRLEDVTSKELSFTPIGTTQYGINLTTLGASAAPLYLRAGKQLQRFLKKLAPGTVTRLDPIYGKDTDQTGASAIAWAYWEVTAKTGAGPYDLTVKAIHGGDGPIAFDDQFNHVNLPGGANSLYLEAQDGTRYQITGSVTATQIFRTPTNPTAIAVGDWVRVVASATGKHLTFLDNPAAIASYGVLAGQFEASVDDTLQLAKNALQETWTTPAARPDGWTGVGSRTQVANEFVTAGQALAINLATGSGVQLAAPGARSWKITNRRAFFSVTALIRLMASFFYADSQVVLRLKAGATVLGEMGYGRDRYNEWAQLQLSGIDLSAYVGTTPSLTAELVTQAPSGAETFNLRVDNICFGPAYTARAPAEGSHGARAWQEANRWLKDVSPPQVAYEVEAADLDALGVAGQVPVILGQTCYIYPDEAHLPSVITARLLQIEDRSETAAGARHVIGVLPARATRKQVTPPDLVIPMIEPVHVQRAKDDAKNAALLCKVITPFTQTATQITVTLLVTDSRGGTPLVTAVALGGATIASGSGAGPWVINRPAAGVGRVIFTAALPGRADVWDAVDVQEQSLAALVGTYTFVSTTSAQVVARIFASDGVGGASVTATRDDGGLTVTPVSGGTFTSIASAIGTPAPGQYIDLTITRPTVGAGSRIVKVGLTASGRNAGNINIDVPAQDRDTVALVCRAKLQTINATTVVIRVAVADPFPPGGASATVNYTLDTAGSVTPATGGTLTPTADLATTGFIDYTVDRPNASSPARRFTLTATDTVNGRIPGTAGVDVPPQDPPALDLKSEWVSDTQWKLTWVATGTVEVSLNGGAYAAPGITSGVAFNRPAYGAKDDVYAFRVTSGGLVISNTVTVPAQVVLSPVLTVSLPAVGAGSTVDFAWTFSGMPSGVTFATSYTAFNSSGALTGAAGQATGLTASPWNQTPSPARATGDYYTVTIAAEYQGKVLATRTRTGLLT